MRAKYVLVGNSAAGLAAIDWIRRYDGQGDIVLVNREAGPAYSRVALPYYVAGEMSLDDLLIRRRDDYDRNGVRLLDGCGVTAIDAQAREVRLSGGDDVGFERLLIATGSECVAPPITGLDSVTAHFLWTLDDAKALKTAAERARTAVIIGGGFIGMLAAEALRKLGIRMTVVEMADQLLPQLLDPEGGRRFGRAVDDEGVEIHLGTVVDAVAPAAGGGVELHLRGGQTTRADLVVVAAGVRPNLSCLGGPVCATNRGIVVNQYLESSVPGIYAAGDVAEAKDFLSADGTALHAIWPTAVEQGRVAGANMAGAKIAYDGSLGMNVVELFKVTLAQVGRFREASGDQVKLLGGPGASAYRKVVVDPSGVLVGGMYLGESSGVAEMGVLQGLIKRRSTWREFETHGLPRFTYATTVHAVPEVRT